MADALRSLTINAGDGVSVVIGAGNAVATGEGAEARVAPGDVEALVRKVKRAFDDKAADALREAIARDDGQAGAAVQSSGYLGSSHVGELIELIAAWVTCDRCLADRSRRSHVARGDARATQVQLTPTGWRRIDGAFTDQIANEQRLLDEVARADQHALERILRPGWRTTRPRRPVRRSDHRGLARASVCGVFRDGIDLVQGIGAGQAVNA